MADKRSWIVEMKCVVVKEIVTEDCTESEARNDPWGHVMGEEQEIRLDDWDVMNVEPNE